MASLPCYSIDTSALVDWWVRSYPPRVFKGLVPRMEQLIAEGRLRASREVRDELDKQDDALLAWAKGHPDLWVESGDAVQGVVAELMAQYFNPQKPDKGIGNADPFVIGVAATEGAHWAVVTGEKPGSVENPKIPFVCRRFQPQPIRSLSFLELIVAEGWELH